MKKINTLLVFTLFGLVNINAQQKFNTSQLEEDFNILKVATAELSPNITESEKQDLYQSLSKKEEQLKGKSMSSVEFFRFLMKHENKANLDDHATFALPNDVMMELLGENKVLFPIPIVVMGHQLVVNHKEMPIPYGSIITAINQKSVPTILDDFIKPNSTYDQRNVEQMFNLMYLIKYGKTDEFIVEYQEPNSNQKKQITLKGVDIETYTKSTENQVYPLNKQALGNVINAFAAPIPNTYYLQLNSFSAPEGLDNQTYFYNAFSEIFKEIKEKKSKNLVIDLRYNGGGNVAIPSMLYYFIGKKKFTEEIRLTIPDFDFPYQENITAVDFIPINKNQMPEVIANLKKDFKKKGNHFENLIEIDVNPEGNEFLFTGNVYLLVGGRTFSSASYFSGMFRAFNRGKIIGEQVGGSHHNMTAGRQLTYTLPNTKIELTMPVALYQLSEYIAKNAPNKHVQPDVSISDDKKYDYLVKEKDWEIEKVAEMIMKNK